jgi:hypothetical protein
MDRNQISLIFDESGVYSFVKIPLIDRVPKKIKRNP